MRLRMNPVTKVILQLIRVQRAAGVISQSTADWWTAKIRELDASAPAADGAKEVGQPKAA